MQDDQNQTPGAQAPGMGGDQGGMTTPPAGGSTPTPPMGGDQSGPQGGTGM